LLDGVVLSKHCKVLIDLPYMMHDPQYWVHPHQFIPERFDENSPLYLTPKGLKRPPLCYTPFFMGPRSCIATNTMNFCCDALIACFFRNHTVHPVEDGPI